LGTVVTVGTAGAVLVATRGTGAGATKIQPLPVQTAAVTRQDLVRQDSIDGTLGYGGGFSISGSGAGIITWLPSAGRVIGQGQTVYRVNNLPVPLLRGSTPFWRPLAAGMSDGIDIQELEQNLSDLGYFHRTPNKEFTDATAVAIKKWQKSLGVPQTGRLDPASVVLLSSDIRVTSVSGVLGQPAQGKILDASGTQRVVTVKMPVDKQSEAKTGGAVTVTMPDGSEVPGKVASIGAVASTPPATGPDANSAPTVTVVVTLGAGAPVLDQAPVKVLFVAERKEKVLTVPVSALLALAEGGYAVQQVTSTGRRLVAVTTGMYAGDRVEVTGAGVTEGMKITVAAE
jgi:hypothetical protein